MVRGALPQSPLRRRNPPLRHFAFVRAPKILAVASAVDLDFRYGCTPAWWQLWKGLYEVGVDLIVTPYRGRPIESPWWRTAPNPTYTEGESFARARDLVARIKGDSHLLGMVQIGGAGTFGDLAVITNDGRHVYATFDAGISGTGGVAVVDVSRRKVVATWAYPGTGRPHGIWYSGRKPPSNAITKRRGN